MLNNENKLTETLGKKMTNVASFIVAGKSISLIINLVTFIIIARYLVLRRVFQNLKVQVPRRRFLELTHEL